MIYQNDKKNDCLIHNYLFVKTENEELSLKKFIYYDK